MFLFNCTVKAQQTKEAMESCCLWCFRDAQYTWTRKLVCHGPKTQKCQGTCMLDVAVACLAEGYKLDNVLNFFIYLPMRKWSRNARWLWSTSEFTYKGRKISRANNGGLSLQKSKKRIRQNLPYSEKKGLVHYTRDSLHKTRSRTAYSLTKLLYVRRN